MEGEEVFVPCDICGKSCKGKHGVIVHKAKAHAEKRVEKKKKKVKKPEKKSPGKIGANFCPLCGAHLSIAGNFCSECGFHLVRVHKEIARQVEEIVLSSRKRVKSKLSSIRS